METSRQIDQQKRKLNIVFRSQAVEKIFNFGIEL